MSMTFTIGWLYPSKMNIYGDRGNDTFIIGRVTDTVTVEIDGQKIEVVNGDDGITAGVSFNAMFFGGGGDDYFEVNHNVGVLDLFGESGDDTFFLKAHRQLRGAATEEIDGGDIITYDRLRESREEIGARIAGEQGRALVKPFDDPFVIAGQGTIGLEIAEEISPDVVLTPGSGGGLVCGTAIGVQARHPHAQVYAVEPEGHDDIARSLAAGSIQTNAPGVRSICDALLVDRMGDITFEIARTRLAGALAVSDEDVRAAMRFAFANLKIVLEPSGAIALAAALFRRDEIAGEAVIAVCHTIPTSTLKASRRKSLFLTMPGLSAAKAA